LGKYCKYGERKESGWEKLLCDHLCKQRIAHEHQPYVASFSLDSGKILTYKPDIVAHGIIIEPHGSRDDAFIRKMHAFRQAYPDKKVILVVRNDDIPSIPNDVYDEILPIEHYDLLKQTLHKLMEG